MLHHAGQAGGFANLGIGDIGIDDGVEAGELERRKQSAKQHDQQHQPERGATGKQAIADKHQAGQDGIHD